MNGSERRVAATTQTAGLSSNETVPQRSIIPFKFEQTTVRVLTECGEPWFVARDVANLLGYRNSRDAIARHCKGGRETRLPSAGGNQVVRLIPERDVYRLIMRSKLPAAEAFEDWVVSDVLPSLRKTGGYGQPAVPQSLPDALRLAADLAEENERLQISHDALDRLSNAEGDCTPTAAAKVLQIKPKQLFQWLEANRWIHRTGERWSAYQSRIDQGHLRHKERTIQVDSQREKRVHQLLVTPRGLTLLSKRLTEEAV